MVAVRCPWGDRRLEAADGDILSSALAKHLHRDHRLDLPDPEVITGGRERPVSSLAELGEDGGVEGSPIYGDRLTQRGGDLYGVTGPPQRIGMPRTDDDKFVECPMCGLEVQGQDENALSANLKEHMSSIHQLP